MNNDSTKFDEKYGFQQLNLNLASGQKALLGPDSITVARDPERTLEKPHAVMEGGKEPASEFTKDVFDVIQKTGPSISGRSRIKYETANAKSGTPLIRVTQSSGGGTCSCKWYRVQGFLDLLNDAGSKFCSGVLAEVYPEESKNNAGFMLAGLRNEGYVELLPGQGPWRPKVPRYFRLVHS